MQCMCLSDWMICQAGRASWAPGFYRNANVGPVFLSIAIFDCTCFFLYLYLYLYLYFYLYLYHIFICNCVCICIMSVFVSVFVSVFASWAAAFSRQAKAAFLGLVKRRLVFYLIFQTMMMACFA